MSHPRITLESNSKGKILSLQKRKVSRVVLTWLQESNKIFLKELKFLTIIYRWQISMSYMKGITTTFLNIRIVCFDCIICSLYVSFISLLYIEWWTHSIMELVHRLPYNVDLIQLKSFVIVKAVSFCCCKSPSPTPSLTLSKVPTNKRLFLAFYFSTHESCY